MSLTDIPCLIMRGGTSRAPFFDAHHLPAERNQLSNVLISAMGAGSPLQVDGIGGGQPTTSKVAMLSPSDHDWADIDYFFAQVHPEKPEVDFAPSCGNILSAVGPAALEMGMIQADREQTHVRIRNTNTDALIEAIVQTPQQSVSYEGNARIDGVPGTAAPVVLNFMEVIGSKTGALFPTGESVNTIDNTEVTCIDVAMPMVIGRAADFGISGYESREVLDANKALFEKMESIRLQAGRLMGLGDVSESVVPKFGLLAPPLAGGTIAARYFMPWSCHPSYAVTGSICTGSCVLAPSTVATSMAVVEPAQPVELTIEHPSGSLQVIFDYQVRDHDFELNSAGILRTARRIFSGSVTVPATVWAPPSP